jgi:hypothetical protein
MLYSFDFALSIIVWQKRANPSGFALFGCLFVSLIFYMEWNLEILTLIKWGIAYLGFIGLSGCDC